MPPARHPTPADRWLDARDQAELALADLANQEFLGDTMPVAWPNLGPEVFAAFYGCPLHFGDYGTSWSEPILHDWAAADRLALAWDDFYMRKLIEMIDALLQIGQGKFIVGMSDWHPGGDCLAALRDPQNLALDVMDHPREIKALLARIEQDYFRVYDFFYRKLRAAVQPISTWTTLVCDGRYYLPSNDFSCMISRQAFDDLFLPGIADECRFLDRSLYHLDGPGALRHLDSLLAIPELDAVQWEPGAGRQGFLRWLPVYRKIQAAGKGVQVTCDFAEVPAVIETLDPHGVYLYVKDVPSRAAALDLLRRLERWPCRSGSGG